MSTSIYIKSGRYYTIVGAADYMGCTDSRIRQLVKSGVLSVIEISPRIRLVPEGELKKDRENPPTLGRPRVSKKLSE
jgi:hypothetical protein